MEFILHVFTRLIESVILVNRPEFRVVMCGLKAPFTKSKILNAQKRPQSFWMKNEVYYKQRQRAVSSHVAAVSSVQITLFDWLVEFARRQQGWVSNSTLRPSQRTLFPAVARRGAPLSAWSPGAPPAAQSRTVPHSALRSVLFPNAEPSQCTLHPPRALRSAP